MAETPIYTFHQCIGELSQLQSEWPPIEPDKRTQSVWKSWHAPRWWEEGQWPKEPPPGICQPPLRQEYPVNGSSGLLKETSVGLASLNFPGQVECELLLFWLSSSPFVFLSHLPLPSPPSVCLVSPSVRLVSLHADRQPVSLSSF